jgi:hypothetical protein
VRAFSSSAGLDLTLNFETTALNTSRYVAASCLVALAISVDRYAVEAMIKRQLGALVFT